MDSRNSNALADRDAALAGWAFPRSRAPDEVTLIKRIDVGKWQAR